MFAAVHVVTLMAVAGDPGSLHPALNPAAVAAIGPLVGHCRKDQDSRESVRQTLQGLEKNEHAYPGES